MQDFRIALAQCCPSPTGSVDDNVALITERFTRGATNKADLVAFPEVTLSGYTTVPEEAEKRSFPLDSLPVERVVRLTETHPTCCAFGLFEQRDGHIYNTYIVAARGRILGVFHKMHTPGREPGLFVPGESFNVIDLPFARLGCGICFDNEIPETHLCLAVKGAEFILMPGAWADHWEREDYVEPCTTDEEVVAERRRWMTMMFGARCRDTGTYSAYVNHSGLEGSGPARFVGKSMVFAPTGKIVAEAKAWDEELLFADIDAQLLARYRTMESFAMKARRPEVYSTLVERTSEEATDSKKDEN